MDKKQKINVQVSPISVKQVSDCVAQTTISMRIDSWSNRSQARNLNRWESTFNTGDGKVTPVTLNYFFTLQEKS